MLLKLFCGKEVHEENEYKKIIPYPRETLGHGVTVN
jgi:hypothetical protein